MNDKARKYEALIMQRLAKVGQTPCALQMNISESTVSRLQSEHLGKVCLLLEALDLKVVPTEMKCYRPEDIEPYIQIAKQHMARINGLESLQWEDG
tara:strand:- start:47 stop:334 length:288 start_codon:yes stop_codon:yes gene_type:complete